MKNKKWVLPALTVVLFLAANLAAWWWYSRIVPAGRSAVPRPTLGEDGLPHGEGIPDDPRAPGTQNPDEVEEMLARELEGQYCKEAQKAKVPAKEYMLAVHGSDRIGRPESTGSRVEWGGFPVISMEMERNLNEVTFPETIRREAVRQAICTWAAPLLEVDGNVVAAKGGFGRVQKIRVILPLAVERQPEAPLQAGTIEKGLAVIGRRIPSPEVTEADVAAFLDEVRATGLQPRGRLLVRMDTGPKRLYRDETVQFIQPVVAP